jgi:hypothetical protein
MSLWLKTIEEGFMKKIVIMIYFLFITTSCTSGSSYEIVEVQTSEVIRLWDGRTGVELIVESKDYITRITDVVENLRYYKIESSEQEPGSSYNIYFEDEDGNKSCNISMAWPEDTVYINSIGYEIIEEDKYLLYGLVADYMYLFSLYEN